MEEKSVAIVTGASQGIGRSIAEKLALSGWHVVLFARRLEVLNEVVDALRSEGGSAEARVVDMRDPEAVASAIGEVADRHGRLDGLVNNAARYAGRKIVDTSLEDFRKNFIMNVDAVFIAMKAALPFMIAQERGVIINIGSISGLRASPGTGGYGASKAALFHLGAIAAMEVGEYNIRVNTVTPGSTWSPTFRKSVEGKSDEEIEMMQKSGTILGRFGETSEVADAVAFLMSEEARFITGVNLPVDGGAYWFRGGNRMIGRR